MSRFSCLPRLSFVFASLFVISIGGCERLAAHATSDRPSPDPRGLDRTLPAAPPIFISAPIAEAFCEIDVDGVLHDTETDYVARVITCENGGADLEALKALAISARSIAYYSMIKAGTICDSSKCQVYSCNTEPSAKHIQAAVETAGQYLSFDNPKGPVLTYGFYVAGDKDHSDACVGLDPSKGAEKHITYNEGKSGVDVEQTSLGYQHDPDDTGYGQNRGCLGQWSSRCLEEQGYDHLEILQFFYGEDIDVLVAEGCSEGDTTGGDSDSSSASSGSSDSGSSGSSGSSDSGSSGGSSFSGSGGIDGTGTWGDSDSGTSDGESATSGIAGLPPGYGDDDELGCACKASDSGAPYRGAPWLALICVVGLVRRRR